MNRRQRVIDLIFIKDILNNNDYLLSDKTIHSIMEHINIDLEKTPGLNKK